MKKWLILSLLLIFSAGSLTIVTSSESYGKESRTSKKFKKKARGKRKVVRKKVRRKGKRTGKKAKPYNPLYAFIVVDAASGKVLSSFNASAKTHPASLTKMMTAYLVFEALEKGQLNMDQQLKVSRHAARQMSSKLWLKSGTTIRLKDALYSVIVKSANDSAVVLGEAVAGTEAKFAYLMTKKARQLGMYRTFFKNASGVPNVRQVTTARDMMILARALYHRFPQHYHIFGNKTFNYGKRKFRNTNKLLGRVEGVDGIKTGYIRMSGFNLVASAMRGGKRIIAVVMGGKTSRWRNQQMTRLINSTFNAMRISAPRPLVKPVAPKDIKLETHQIVELLDKSHVKPGHPTEGPSPLPAGKLAQLKEQLAQQEFNEIDELEGFEVQVAEESKEKKGDDRNSDDDIDLPGLPSVKELQLDQEEEEEGENEDDAEDEKTEKKIPEITVTKMSTNPPKWAIQVGAYKSAKSAYKRTQSVIKTYKLPGKTFVSRVGKGKKTLYQARIKNISKSQASRTCVSLKKAGEGCLVLPPKR